MAVAHEIIQKLGREWWVVDSDGNAHLKSRQDSAARESFGGRSPNRIRKDGWMALGGCSDFCQLFVEEARKRGVKANFVLTGGELNERGMPEAHTLVRIFDTRAKKWKVIDPKWFAHPYVRRFMYDGGEPKNAQEAEFAKAARSWREEGLQSEQKGNQTHIYRVFASHHPDLNRKLLARTTAKLDNIPDMISFLAKEQKARNRRLDEKGDTASPRHRLAARSRLLKTELEP